MHGCPKCICRAALLSVDEAAANAIDEGVCDELDRDLKELGKFFADHRDEELTRLVDTVTETYAEATADQTVRHSSVCDYLVNWYLDEYATEEEAELEFDPYDESQVDLSGIVNAKVDEEAAG